MQPQKYFNVAFKCSNYKVAFRCKKFIILFDGAYIKEYQNEK